MITEMLYDLIFSLPMTLFISSFVCEKLGAKDSLWIAIPTVMIFCMILMKHLKARGRAILSGVILAFILAVPAFSFIPGRLMLLKWFLLTLGCFILYEILERYKPARLIASLLGCGILVFLLIWRMDVSKLGVCMAFIFLLFTIADEFQVRSKKQGGEDRKKHLIAIAPFILVIFVITAFMDVPEEPYDWAIVKTVAGYIKSEYIAIKENLFEKNGWDSGDPVIGFSDRADVGGDLAQGERTVMKITSNVENDPKMYLAGKTFDTFDGKSWDKTDDSATDERTIDTIETMSAVLDYGGEEFASDMTRRVSATVEFVDMHTLCLFAPAKTLQVKDDDAYLKRLGGDFVFTEKKYAKEPYTIVYNRFNKDSDEFKKMLNSPHSLTPESFMAAKERSAAATDVNFEDYKKYHDQIYRYYLSDVTLSPELKSYMDDLLSGAETDYEKLLRLEGMFADFTYTDSPGKLPESIQNPSGFLDYFILEKKAGYCSYYATSFVLLARAYGIPARYVQGFAVPFGNYQRIEVSSARAHAWPEAYIDGVGWFVFEPTPGMKKEVLWAVDGNENNNDRSTIDNMPPAADDLSAIESDTKKQKPVITVRWYGIVIPITAGLALALVIVLIDQLIKSRRYKKMDEKNKAITICENSLRLLKRKKLGIGDFETLSEYSLRLSESIDEDKLYFLKTYEELLYSKRTVTRHQREQMEADYRELFAYCRRLKRGVAQAD